MPFAGAQTALTVDLLCTPVWAYLGIPQYGPKWPYLDLPDGPKCLDARPNGLNWTYFEGRDPRNGVEMGSNWPILEGPEPQICLDARPTDLQRA